MSATAHAEVTSKLFC